MTGELNMDYLRSLGFVEPYAFLMITQEYMPNEDMATYATWIACHSLEERQEVLDTYPLVKRKYDLTLKYYKENLKVKQAGWELFKANKNVRRAVFLGVLLQFMQQLTGFNIIMYYSPKILSIAGFSSTEEQMIGTVVNGLVFVLATFIAVGTVDKSGRKPALSRCFAIMAVSLFVLGLCFFGLESGNTSTWIPYLSAGMVILAIIGFGFGAGPVVWILCSEIQPLKSRDFGIACSTMTNWLSCTLIGATFLTLLDTLGSTMTFWLYAALNALFVYLTMRYVPETKGVTLEKIEQNLMEGKKLKDIGC